MATGAGIALICIFGLLTAFSLHIGITKEYHISKEREPDFINGFVNGFIDTIQQSCCFCCETP